VDVTPKANVPMGNLGWPNVGTFALTIQANNIDLSTTTPTFCVGQSVGFLPVWNSDPSGYSDPPNRTDIVAHWTLPGKFVNEEYEYSPSCWSYHENATLLNNFSTGCWFVNGTGGQCSVTMALYFSNGQSVTIQAFGGLMIYRPQVQFDIVPTPAFYPVIWNGYLEVGYDSGDGPGGGGNDAGTVQFDAKITSEMPFTGIVNWVQLNVRSVSPPFHKIGANSGDTGGATVFDHGFGVDGYNKDDSTIDVKTIGYPPHGSIDLYDSPGILILPTYDSETVNNDYFHTYLQFYPDTGGIWVTLGVVTWGWGATENYNGGSPILSNPWTQQPKYIDTDAFPLYSQ
jgi:hypothetical protein